MSRLLPATNRFPSRIALSVLALATGVAGLGIPVAASASPSASGATGLHDRMMPADSPDATVTAGIAADTQAGSPTAPVGPDVSRWQHPSGAAIDWAQVAASGQSFAMVKATELYTDSSTGQPVLYTNPYLHSDLDGAHAAGLVVGTYAFAHPENSATAQADDFAAAIGTLPTGSLPPVLDLEVNGGLSVTDLVTWTQAFLDRLESDTGVLPMIYTGPNFWKSYLGNSTAFAGYPLWEAHYTTASAPAAIGGWSTYTLWQWTDAASIPGISGGVDQSRFNNTTGASLENLHFPIGSFDAAQESSTGLLTTAGWAIDPDTPTTPVTVHIYVDSQGQPVSADGYRPDVGAIFPAAGNQHGFSSTTQLSPGTHTVCAYAIDTTLPDQHTTLGCRTVTFTPILPIGSFDVAQVSGTGTLTTAGWALDNDTPTTPVTVQVAVDGQAQSVTTNGYRPDVGAIFPAAGNQHGFSSTTQLSPGTHTVCAYAIDTTYSDRQTTLGCKTVTFTPNLPIGSFDVAQVSGTGTLTTAGWALDNDTPTTPVTVHIYVDSQGQPVSADGYRPDVGAIFPAAGNQHGFSSSTQLSPGTHTVCAYAIDTTFGDQHTTLGCKTVTFTPNLPIGSFDVAQVSGTGTLTTAGWALDNDTPTTPVTVQVAVDGQAQSVSANGYRPDVGAIFPAAGNQHGFSSTTQLSPGTHTVCAYAIDTTLPDQHTTLGCKTVTY